jgi:hypothetical protein
MNDEIKTLFGAIPKDIFKLKIIHHGALANTIFASGYLNDKTINLSKDLVLLQVNDNNALGSCRIFKTKFTNPNQLINISVPVYEKWLTKPRELVKYIKENYKKLPNYILYTDGTDTVILNDITSPKEILDFYECDVIFNCEPNYSHTGFGLPSHGYYSSLYENTDVYLKLNEKKYGRGHLRSLNAGVFLGKKDYVIEMLDEALLYMEDDYNKGFPYGCLDDQCMFRHLQNIHFDKIAVDVFNNYFLFAYPTCMTVDEDNWEHFQYYKNNYEQLYLDIKKTKNTSEVNNNNFLNIFKNLF